MLLPVLLRACRTFRAAAAAILVAGSSVVSAAPPSFTDSIAQRSLACTGCHGQQGRAAADGFYPRIAGKPAGYLHNQLLNFRDGRRHYPVMTHLLAQLTDDYLLEMATYFSQLDLPYPPPAMQASGAAAARGQALVTSGDKALGVPACVQCHGAAMTGVAPSIPGLLGLPRHYITAQFGAWRTGQRRAHAPDCMLDIARRLTVDDVDAVAVWLASQPVPASAKPADRLPGPLPIACGGVPTGGRP